MHCLNYSLFLLFYVYWVCWQWSICNLILVCCVEASKIMLKALGRTVLLEARAVCVHSWHTLKGSLLLHVGYQGCCDCQNGTWNPFQNNSIYHLMLWWQKYFMSCICFPLAINLCVAVMNNLIVLNLQPSTYSSITLVTMKLLQIHACVHMNSL